jgi:large subunit ribosomal protein L3
MAATNKVYIGRKLGMTQIFTDQGECIPVTVIAAPPVHVVEVKSPAKHGYAAFKVALDPQKESRLTKPALGVLKKAGAPPSRTLRELRVGDTGDVQAGQQLTLARLEGAQFVDVSGRTRGRGFSGVVRRWSFAGAPYSHGQTEGDRVPGSLGRQHSISQGIPPGKRMAGRYGNERSTVKNVELVKLDPEKNLIFVRGSIPGPTGGLVTVREGYRRKHTEAAAAAKAKEAAKKKKVL